MTKNITQPRFVVCVKNDGYLASLEPRKIYPMLPDEKAAKHGLIRVIDESGEGYLYPADFFVVALPHCGALMEQPPLAARPAAHKGRGLLFKMSF